jgi:D-3-phosphoglycerate dehydrogenase
MEDRIPARHAEALPIVVIAEAIATSGVAVLEECYTVVDAVGKSREELLGLLAFADALIVRSGTEVDVEMIAAAPRLRVIGRAGIGVDNIDLKEATRIGALVVNAPDANTISAAEHTMALLLAQARHVARADASLRNGVWDRGSFRGVELYRKTLGVVGLGRIGTLVAHRGSAFGMDVIAFDPFVSDDKARQLGVVLMDLDSLLAKADFVTVHLPRTRDTEGLIGRDAFAKMKPDARLINVARGGIVDEEALAAAVKSGQIAGAGVDVFAEEPTTISPLFELDAVVVTPHLGASTLEAQDKAGVAVAEAVADALAGELVLSAVNIDVGSDVSVEVKTYLPLCELLGQIFASFAQGLPEELVVCGMGRLSEWPVRPLALGALRGALQGISEDTVSYVNAPLLAEARGVNVREQSTPESPIYQAMVRLTGIVDGRERAVAGTITASKGPVLVEVDGYEMELPITDHMLLIRNDDVPGMIGKIGSLLGSLDINIRDMVVGHRRGSGAMMGLCLDGPLSDDDIGKILDSRGISAARYIDLS